MPRHEFLGQTFAGEECQHGRCEDARKIPTKRTMAPERKEVSHDLRDSIGLRIAFTCFRTRPPDGWTPNFQGTYSKSISFVNTAKQIHLLDQGTDTLRSQSYHAKIAIANIAKEHLDFWTNICWRSVSMAGAKRARKTPTKTRPKGKDDAWYGSSSCEMIDSCAALEGVKEHS